MCNVKPQYTDSHGCYVDDKLIFTSIIGGYIFPFDSTQAAIGACRSWSLDSGSISLEIKHDDFVVYFTHQEGIHRLDLMRPGIILTAIWTLKR